ncbi:MAG: hypothetical protein LBQ77_08580 [Treponema sp.]|nr:hypothetical protein [Treponema sp.]
MPSRQEEVKKQRFFPRAVSFGDRPLLIWGQTSVLWGQTSVLWGQTPCRFKKWSFHFNKTVA